MRLYLETIKVSEGLRGGAPFLKEWVPWKKRTGHQSSLSFCAHTEGRPGEDTERKWLSSSQAEKSYQRPNILAA